MKRFFLLRERIGRRAKDRRLFFLQFTRGKVQKKERSQKERVIRRGRRLSSAGEGNGKRKE